MSSRLVRQVANFIGLTVEEVLDVSDNAPNRYKRYKIPKRSGGQRTIYQPPKETKALQYALMTLCFNELQIHDIATAYIKGKSSPQRITAELHSNYKYSVRIDYKDFFYSIKPEDVFRKCDIRAKSDDKDFLKKCCYVKDADRWWLAIGSPSSPMISNAVVVDIDGELYNASKQIDPDSEITRYADDIVFSSNIEGKCFSFHDKAKQLIDGHASPDLTLNPSKTSFMSRGNRRVIAGLVITPDGRVSIGRKKKRQIRAMLHEYCQGSLDPEELKSLSGYLAWILDVEPNLFGRYAYTYGASVLNDALSGEQRDHQG